MNIIMKGVVYSSLIHIPYAETPMAVVANILSAWGVQRHTGDILSGLKYSDIGIGGLDKFYSDGAIAYGEITDSADAYGLHHDTTYYFEAKRDGEGFQCCIEQRLSDYESPPFVRDSRLFKVLQGYTDYTGIRVYRDCAETRDLSVFTGWLKRAMSATPDGDPLPVIQRCGYGFRVYPARHILGEEPKEFPDKWVREYIVNRYQRLGYPCVEIPEGVICI